MAITTQFNDDQEAAVRAILQSEISSKNRKVTERVELPDVLDSDILPIVRGLISHRINWGVLKTALNAAIVNTQFGDIQGQPTDNTALVNYIATEIANAGGGVDVLGTLLAGLLTNNNSNVQSTDSIIVGIGKLQAQITAAMQTINNQTYEVESNRVFNGDPLLDKDLINYTQFNQAGAQAVTKNSGTAKSGGVGILPWNSDGSTITWSTDFIADIDGLNASLPATLPNGINYVYLRWNPAASKIVVSVPTAGGGGGSGGDLGYAASPTQGVVTNTGGTNAILPLADNTNSGLLAPADKSKLDNAPVNTNTELSNKLEDVNLGYTASPTGGQVTNDAGSNSDLTLVDSTNAGLMSPAQSNKLASIDATHYLDPLQNTTDLANLTEASLADKARTYVEDEQSDYFYDQQAVSGDVAPNDQTGGTGFWRKVSVGGETPASIKTKYESNADTNAFTDSNQTKLDGLANADLGYTPSTTAGEITNTAGSNATIPQAGLNAGLMSAADKAKLDSIPNIVLSEDSIYTALTPGSGVVWATSVYKSKRTLLMGQNTTLDIQDMTEGQQRHLKITQDATGNWSLAIQAPAATTLRGDASVELDPNSVTELLFVRIDGDLNVTRVAMPAI